MLWGFAGLPICSVIFQGGYSTCSSFPWLCCYLQAYVIPIMVGMYKTAVAASITNPFFCFMLHATSVASDSCSKFLQTYIQAPTCRIIHHTFSKECALSVVCVLLSVCATQAPSRRKTQPRTLIFPIKPGPRSPSRTVLNSISGSEMEGDILHLIFFDMFNTISQQQNPHL